MTETREQFGNSDERECPPLEGVTRELVKTVAEDTSLCAIVIVTSCVFKSLINPVTSSNPVHSQYVLVTMCVTF